MVEPAKTGRELRRELMMHGDYRRGRQREFLGTVVVDLDTGRRCRLPYESILSLHPTRSWAAAHLPSGDGCLRVVDLSTGEALAPWVGSPDAATMARGYWAGFFIGDDLLAVLEETGFSVVRGLAVWAVGRGRLVAWHKDLMVGTPRSAALNGRAAWNRDTPEGQLLEVVDLLEGHLLLTLPLQIDAAQTYGPGMPSPVLSPDGRTVLSAAAGGLFEVDSGRRLWSAPADFPSVAHSRLQFRVFETWRVAIGSWVKEFKTLAVCRLDTGALEYRAGQYRAGQWPLKYWQVDDDGTTLVAETGEVYQLPLSVNYPLLALCQAILALPLVLTWLALRWRRKRRLRLAGAAP